MEPLAFRGPEEAYLRLKTDPADDGTASFKRNAWTMMRDGVRRAKRDEAQAYRLDDQIGFILRQVLQRHAGIFTAGMENEITATQWAALVKLHEGGPLSQNLLGRLIAMDAATVKGVIDRLSARGLTGTGPDPTDRRRHLVALTDAGRIMVERLLPQAARVTDDTLAPLNSDERADLIGLLTRLC